MGPGEVGPGRDPPVRAEIVHESDRTRVTRLFLPGGTVIRKEPLGPDAERRARLEAAILERLRDVPRIAQLADTPRYPGSIVLADVGGTSLAGLAKPLPADDLVGLALGLARAVAGMHRRGIMHRDITPANFVVSGDGTPCLVDFAVAAPLVEAGPEGTGPGELVGTLAYLAPEATGRTGRAVDARADLYALGAVLYELATGEPPFGSGDPLRLAHDHLARVPVPPDQVNPAVPTGLSQVIKHLLEKDPDRRYQTGDGLVADLERVRDAGGRPGAGWRPGERDVPRRLLAPARLAGRAEQVAALQSALAEAVAGRCAGVLVGGVPGVGKTALAGWLRPVVAARGGWFVAGKSDPFRRDLEFDPVNQALRALGRLLLAEPEEDLTQIRGRVLAAAGPNAGLLAAAVPEFAALLGVAPEAGDSLTAQTRAQHAAVGVMRAVASPGRPLVVFVDDLQWAGRPALGFVDLVLGEEPAAGLLLVAAYRDGGVDGAQPLTPLLTRWREIPGVRHLGLGNLPSAELGAMVAEMLRVDPSAAAGLAGVIEPQTSGNPYETVELLNALRRDGVLTAAGGRWRWDAAVVRAHLGQAEVAGLVTAQVEALPPGCRRLVEVMACLGGRAEVSVLQAATGTPATVMEQALVPALEEGVLLAEPGAGEAVRFRHDRVREAVLAGIDPPRRQTLRLGMARRLAAVPELFAVAAGQYLPVADVVEETAERRQVAGLLRRAANQAALIGDYPLVDALLTAALRLIGPDETDALIEARTARHAALFSLGRLEEADEDYRAIGELCPAVLQRAEATAVQVRSLTHRNRHSEALRLGIESLRELGTAVPTADSLPAALDHQSDLLYRWLDHTAAADDLARPAISDPAMIAASGLINATLVPAYFGQDLSMHAWLSLEALRILIEHGPGRALIGPACQAAFSAVVLRGDYLAGYRCRRRLLALGEARGYEPDTSEVRFLFALLSCWVEPIESGVQHARQARDGLIAACDLANAAYTYYTTVYLLLDCEPTLDNYAAEVEAGLAFLRRTGNEQTGQLLKSYRWLADVLRGERSVADEPVPVEDYAAIPAALFHAHCAGALAATIFGDLAGLVRHTAAGMPLLPAALGLYPTAVARLLHGLALAGQARAADGGKRAGLLAELEEVTGWLAVRAADAPDNFLHLLRLLEAERAWAAGDFRAAALAFDAARRAAADDARRRIQRDLHDGAQQRLVSLALFLRATRAAVTPESGEFGAQLDRAAAEAEDALREMREIARGIHPAVLARGGLRPALKALARRSPVRVDLDTRAEGQLPGQVEISAYYVIAEALTNASKHARASAITVTVEADAAGAVLRVAVGDDGAGGADFSRGTGLVGLKDRVEALGGRIFLDSPPGAGTSLRAELPLAAPNSTSPRLPSRLAELRRQE